MPTDPQTYTLSCPDGLSPCPDLPSFIVPPSLSVYSKAVSVRFRFGEPSPFQSFHMESSGTGGVNSAMLLKSSLAVSYPTVCTGMGDSDDLWTVSIGMLGANSAKKENFSDRPQALNHFALNGLFVSFSPLVLAFKDLFTGACVCLSDRGRTRSQRLFVIHALG